MADTQSTRRETVQKAPVKKKQPPQSSKKAKNNYCILCRKSYLKYEAHDHMHSMQHHDELEKVLGKDAFHDCLACKVKSLGLSEYASHILTARHQAKIKNLKTRNVKPVSLYKTLSPSAIKSILERNKTLKKEQRKATKKKRKKQKQEAGQRRAKTQQPVVQIKSLASKGKTQQNPKHMQTTAPNQWQQTHFPGSNCGVIQNKENKMFPMQRPPPHERFPNPHWRPPYQPRVPVGPPVHYQYGWQQNQQWCDGYYDRSQFPQMNMNRFQTRPYLYHKAPADMSQQMVPSVSGAIGSEHGQRDKVKSVQPEGGKTDPVQPECPTVLAPEDSESKSGSSAPIRDVDVNAMLKQIRRALGVREPCRADREARRQNENVRAGEKQDDGGTPAATDLLASTSAPTAVAGVPPSTVPALKQKRTASAEGQETNQTKSPQLKEESVIENGVKSVEISHAPTSVKVASAEPSLSKPSKVQVAQKSQTAKAEKEAVRKPVLDKLLHSSGARSKLNWDEMYSDMKRRSLKGKPRFGIKLGVQPTDSEAPLEDSAHPLSEGFHWESVPDSSSVPTPALPSPHADWPSETPAGSQARASSDVAQASSISKKAEKVTVKVEPNLEDESEDVSGKNKKRTLSQVEEGGISVQSSSKKKKTKSRKDHLDQSQMDQLLAVSLKEDELSHSLQDLDKNLVQARNALQAAYAEVQRLLLLRQQFTVEVNNMRAKRIEILQGMQEGYCGANPAERASTSSPASSTIPTTSFASSLSQQQQPAATPPSFIPLPHPAPLALPAVSLKQEMTHLVAAGRASQLFLPSAVQPTAEGSTSANALLPESSARQQEPEPRGGSKAVKTENLEKQIQTEGNLSTEPDTGEKTEKRQQNVSGADDESDESDSSVEVVDSSQLEVIDIEESECEESLERDAPAPPEDPSSAEFSSASTQTSQQCETERKFQPAVDSIKEANQPTESMEEDEPSLGAFANHSGPVHGLQIHDGRLYTCSGDNTARAYSLLTRECEGVFEGHTNKVNCLLVSSLPNLPIRLYTGSSDETIRCYSVKSKKCLEQITLSDRVLCLHIAWNILYVGLASGCVVSLDLKTLKELDVFECHGPRGVSCLGTAQEGARRLLLVGSYDSTISVRDAKSGLLLRTLEGHTKTVLCMKVVNDLVFSGSSDTSVHAHNIHTGELVRIYKGHGHAVTSIVILGKVMVTACLDQLVRVYELQSHDRLQVYGGHSDMVMCMAVHKSVIYTGCYDGSVQAVKLNLMKNYRCWWQSCSLIFGIPEHLTQHLTRDHSNSNLQTVKCRWKECNHFFSTQQSVREDLPEHMQNHVDNDSKLQL